MVRDVVAKKNIILILIVRYFQFLKFYQNQKGAVVYVFQKSTIINGVFEQTIFILISYKSTYFKKEENGLS